MVTLHSSTETSPVRENNQWKTLILEVLDSLRGLVGRIREPNLTSLRYSLQQESILTFNSYVKTAYTK